MASIPYVSQLYLGCVTALITAVITGHYYDLCGQAYGLGLWAVSYGQLAVR